jgi:hypothetical protein
MKRNLILLLAGLALLIQAIPARSARLGEQARISAAHSLYLSALFKAAGQHGIYGTVTEGGSPAKFLSLYLLIHDGQSWRLRQQARTDFSGNYAFTRLPTLAPGEGYFVRYLNGDNPDRLRIWETRTLTTYAAGEAVDLGSFDIQTVKQVNPAAGETVRLPVTFTWEMRPDTPGASYEFELANLDPENEWSFYADVGAADQFTLESLPLNFFFDQMYYWCVWIHTPDGGKGASFYRLVIFSQAVGEGLGD